jgi:S-adenosylmethionine:tRNA ribosyltransferase-isomerase
MKTSDFDYALPDALIAQTPVEPRDSSRLMILDRRTGQVTHSRFSALGQFLRGGDLLVLNDTRVLPARLKAHKSTGGAVELLLLKRLRALTWEVLLGGKNVRVGARLSIEGREALSAVIMEELDGPRRVVQFSEPVTPLLESIGEAPLPPYIHIRLSDRERYQTVFARFPGSAAAPTAGLHFTPHLLEALAAQDVHAAYLTLHVGLDTFAPVDEDEIDEHKIHTEYCELPGETAAAVNRTRAAGGRILAVGTTSVRTLETAAQASLNSAGLLAEIRPTSFDTGLFITPGYEFKLVDAMITNFHLPRSTLLMLVSAFAGRERILAAYEMAMAEHYRFYSFGDAMLIV